MAVRKSTQIRRREIVEVSLEIIKEYGIQNLSLKRIAQRIGISEQAIYRHFNSKLDILKAIIAYFNEALKQSFPRDVFQESAAATILGLTRAHMEFIQHQPAVAAVIFSEEMFQSQPELATMVKEALFKRLHHMTQIIQKGQAQGEFLPDLNPRAVAHLLLGSLRLTVVVWRLEGFQTDLVKNGQEVVHTILQLISREVLPVSGNSINQQTTQ